MKSVVSVLGSSYDIRDSRLEESLLETAKFFHTQKVLYCCSNSGFLKKIITLMLDYGVHVVGYTCPEYMDDVNPDVKTKIFCSSKLSRQEALIAEPNIIVLFPGGFGTAIELFTILDMMQNKKIDKTLILVNFLKYWDNTLKQISLMEGNKLIKKFDIIVASNIDEMRKALCNGIN